MSRDHRKSRVIALASAPATWWCARSNVLGVRSASCSARRLLAGSALEQAEGWDAQRFRDALQGLQRRRALAAFEHRDVAHRDPRLLRNSFLRELPLHPHGPEVLSHRLFKGHIASVSRRVRWRMYHDQPTVTERSSKDSATSQVDPRERGGGWVKCPNSLRAPAERTLGHARRARTRPAEFQEPSIVRRLLRSRAGSPRIPSSGRGGALGGPVERRRVTDRGGGPTVRAFARCPPVRAGASSTRSGLHGPCPIGITASASDRAGRVLSSWREESGWRFPWQSRQWK